MLLEATGTALTDAEHAIAYPSPWHLRALDAFIGDVPEDGRVQQARWLDAAMFAALLATVAMFVWWLA